MKNWDCVCVCLFPGRGSTVQLSRHLFRNKKMGQSSMSCQPSRLRTLCCLSIILILPFIDLALSINHRTIIHLTICQPSHRHPSCHCPLHSCPSSFGPSRRRPLRCCPSIIHPLCSCPCARASCPIYPIISPLLHTCQLLL